MHRCPLRTTSADRYQPAWGTRPTLPRNSGSPNSPASSSWVIRTTWAPRIVPLSRARSARRSPSSRPTGRRWLDLPSAIRADRRRRAGRRSGWSRPWLDPGAELVRKRSNPLLMWRGRAAVYHIDPAPFRSPPDPARQKQTSASSHVRYMFPRGTGLRFSDRYPGVGDQSLVRPDCRCRAGDRRKIGGQAAIAIGGYGSLAGWNFCPKPEPSVPL